MIYKLLDCGNGQKLELIGAYKGIRPCPQAIWQPRDPELWSTGVNFEFSREHNSKGEWIEYTELPSDIEWDITSEDGLKWTVDRNAFGNIGFFTEHWTYTHELLELFDPQEPVLNLFSYTGSSCLRLAQSGYKITVVDSSKNAITAYNRNLEINSISRDGQRLILEDCFKFIEREVRRSHTYGSLIVDAPSYGRGTKGEVFDIEKDLTSLLQTCAALLKPDGKMVLTLHSPRYTPLSLKLVCEDIFPNKKITSREIVQDCISGSQLPSGFLVIIQ